MNGTEQSSTSLGNQGSQDFTSMLGTSGTQPSTTTTPTPVGQSDGGAANKPPVTISRPLRDTPEGQGQQTPPPEQDGQSQQPPVVPPAQVQTPPGQTPPGQTPPAIPVTAPDQTAIVQAAVEAGIRASREGHGQQQQTQQQQPRMTDAEFAAHYRIPQATPQHIEALLGQDPVRAAQTLNTLLRDTVTSALRMSADVATAEAERVRQEYAPHITSWQAHQRAQVRAAAEKSFYDMYPTLAEEKALVNEVRDAYIMRVKNGQASFKTEQEAFAAVANTVNGIIARFKPQGSNGQQTPGNGQQTPPTGQQSGRQMSAASSAGRTGTGQAPAAQSAVDQVFGEFAR